MALAGMELTGKVALVTGAGSGIGRAAAFRLAHAGARVGVLSRTDQEVNATTEQIRRAGFEAIGLSADVRDASAMEAATRKLVEAFGRLDIAVCNAGIGGTMAPLDEMRPAEWDETIAINLTGSFLTFRSVVPHLKRAGSGAIVIVSSINGTRTFSQAGGAAYACSKAGLAALGQMAARELAKHRIRVNVVCPGSVDTDIGDNTNSRHTERADVKVEYPDGQIPLAPGDSGTPEDVAELILFLVSERSRHITGTPVWIDGGQSLVAG
jgi:NAD(P)-dependent dehydrogenase (short-subunit alcohol dehydrogenase family)